MPGDRWPSAHGIRTRERVSPHDEGKWWSARPGNGAHLGRLWALLDESMDRVLPVAIVVVEGTEDRLIAAVAIDAHVA